jgi:hypothetical protein
MLWIQLELHPLLGTQSQKDDSEHERNFCHPPSDFTSEDESYDNASENMSGTEEYELPVIHELCPLPKIRNKRTSSRSQKSTVLTSSEHKINIKNKKDEKANKDASSKNRIKKTGSHVLRSTKNRGQENADSKCMYCNGLYSEDPRG